MKANTTGRTVKWIRGSLAVLVLGAAAMPAARVYMYSQPIVSKINLLDGDDEINTIGGYGLANSLVQVWYRQRNFHQGDKDGTGSQFSWCGGYNGGWVHAGAALTNKNGGWIMDVDNIRIPTFPSGVWNDQTTAPCSAGLMTEFRAMHTVNSDPSVITTTAPIPELKWFKIKKAANGDQTGNAQGVVEKAWNSMISIADGPNDQDSSNGKTIDTNSIGYDCEIVGAGPCPRRIEFKTSGGDKPAPSISVVENSVFPSDLDPEFVSLLGQMFSSAPGGAIYVTGKRDRPNPLGPAVIKIKIDGLPNCNGIDLIDFFL